jgi:hypothetical protein
MGSSIFWAWIMWLHLAFLLVPALGVAVKFEWEDLRKARHQLPAPHQEVPEYRKAG